MAITKSSDRQNVLAARATWSGAGAGDAVQLPAGARIIGGGVIIDTNIAGTVTVGDAGVAARYGAHSSAAVGYIPLSLTGYKYLETGEVTVNASAASAGSLIVLYVVDGKAHEVQG